MRTVALHNKSLHWIDGVFLNTMQKSYTKGIDESDARVIECVKATNNAIQTTQTWMAGLPTYADPMAYNQHPIPLSADKLKAVQSLQSCAWVTHTDDYLLIETRKGTLTPLQHCLTTGSVLHGAVHQFGKVTAKKTLSPRYIVEAQKEVKFCTMALKNIKKLA